MNGYAGYIDDVRTKDTGKELQMDTQHYFDLLREIRDTSMATVAGDGTPRIRIIDTMLTKNEKLYFLTARGKDFYQELMKTGQVAVTGLNERWETVRLQGKVRNIGHECLDEIFEKNPSMNSVYPGDSREILEVFCLYGRSSDCTKNLLLWQCAAAAEGIQDRTRLHRLRHLCIGMSAGGGRGGDSFPDTPGELSPLREMF